MIPVNTPIFTGNEEKYLMECIRTGWISSEGSFITKFEDEFSAFVRTNHLHAYTCCLMKSVRMALLRSQAVAHTFIQRSRIKFLLLISAPKN